jgi:hypothetical protein
MATARNHGYGHEKMAGKNKETVRKKGENKAL